MTVRQLLADIKQSVKKLNVDDRLDNQFVYSKLIKYTSLVIKRESDSRKIFRQTHLFRTLEFQMKTFSNGLKVSTTDIPDFFTTNNGNLLIVGGKDLSSTFSLIPPEKYQLIKFREFQDPNKKYYWIDNKKIYVPDSYLKNLTVRGLFYNYTDSPCQEVIDTEFPCPDYLLEDVINLVVNSIITREKLPEDENPNMNSNER